MCCVGPCTLALCFAGFCRYASNPEQQCWQRAKFTCRDGDAEGVTHEHANTLRAKRGFLPNLLHEPLKDQGSSEISHPNYFLNFVHLVSLNASAVQLQG